MTDTARDLIQRMAGLADALDGRKRLVSSQGQALDGFTALANFKAIADEARAYLAQSELEGPTVMEINALADEITAEELGLVDFARAVLARWGRPAIQPEPASERPWEREGWCDNDGWCWGFNANDTDPFWVFDHRSWASSGCWTHVLPHYALPIPTTPTEKP